MSNAPYLPASAPATLNDPFGWGLISTIDPALAGGQAGMSVANRGVIARVAGGGTITKLGIHVVNSSGNLSLAVYRANGAGRSTGALTQIGTTGGVACPAAGYAEFALGASVTVNPGDWFGISADNTTATFRCAFAGTLQSNLFLGRSALGNAVYPLPSVFDSAGGAAQVNSYLIVGVA